MRALRWSGLVLSAALGWLAWTGSAHAQLEACGNIDVEAGATCEVEVQGGCMVMCEPLRVEAACAAELYAGCEGGCNADIDVDCMASCNVSDCMARCDVDPGSFRCDGYCRAQATASCETQCSGMAGDGQAQARCRSSCEATFAGECRAQCEVEPPSATCEARCNASCEGYCRGEANVDCQVDCQASGYVDCEARIQGGCQAACSRPEGALFCDGQYVDHGGNLQMCIDALRNVLEINVQVTGMAGCDATGCEASAEASCAATPGAAPGPWWLLGASALSLVALSLLRRRRRG